MKKRIFLWGGLAVVLAGSWMGAGMLQKEATYEPRNSNDINRSEWDGAAKYRQSLLVNNVTGEYQPSDWVRGSREARILDQHKVRGGLGLSWNEEGPFNIGGRIRAVKVDPTDDNIIWTGSVTGGLWKSTDKGNTWEVVSSFDKNPAVCAIEIADNGWIFVGTGSTFETISSGELSGMYGDGVFYSKDNGATWSEVAGTVSGVNNGLSGWSAVNRIKKDGSNSNLLWAVGNLENTSGGSAPVMKINLSSGTPTIEDSGVATNLFNGVGQDLAIEGSTIAVAIAGVVDGVVYSKDGGQTFAQCSFEDGNSDIGRITVAIAPGDANYVYACVTTASNRKLKNVYQSTDAGENFTIIGPGSPTVDGEVTFDPFRRPSLAVGQGTYDNCITVDPNDKEKLFVGGIDLWKRQGGSWEQAAYQGGGIFPSNFSVHADIHAFDWTSDGLLFIATDGGLFTTEGYEPDFVAVNYGLNITQFYDMDVNTEGDMFGGTQDNGLIYLDHSLSYFGQARADYLSAFNGDGVGVACSKLVPDARFGTAQSGQLERSVDDGINYAQFYSTKLSAFGDPGTTLGQFMTRVALYETKDDELSQDYLAYTPSAIESYTAGQTVTVASATFGFEQTYTFSSDTTLYYYDTLDLTDYIVEDGDTTYFFVHPEDDTDTTWFGKKPQVTNVKLDTIWVQDKVQSLFALALGGSKGVWVTRDAYYYGGEPVWFRVDDGDLTGSITAMEFSVDGDAFYFGSSNRLYRVTGLDSAYYVKDDLNGQGFIQFPDENVMTVESIYTAPGPITGIATARKDPSKIVFTVGGFSSDHVFEVTDANGASPSVASIDGSSFPDFPAYAVIIDVTDNSNNSILVGTEFGMWSTTDNGATWTAENDGFVPLSPVFDIAQKPITWGEGTIEGDIFLGTHGRGFWKAGRSVVGIEEATAAEQAVVSGIQLYPNPAVEVANLGFELKNREDVICNIYDLTGKQVYTRTDQRVSVGQHTWEIPTVNLPTGTYVTELVIGGNTFVNKFMVK